MTTLPLTYAFPVGTRVVKRGGDYVFDGEVVAVFAKRSGQTRVVVEDARGLLFIFSPSQLEVAP